MHACCSDPYLTAAPALCIRSARGSVLPIDQCYIRLDFSESAAAPKAVGGLLLASGQLWQPLLPSDHTPSAAVSGRQLHKLCLAATVCRGTAICPVPVPN